MISWPGSLVREVAQRRCILFLGSGVSATAKTTAGVSPPTWFEFLNQASKLVADASERNEIVSLINSGDSLLALQAICDVANPADYQDLLNAVFHSPRYQPSRLHEAVHRLDSRIVVTTNFDRIYEAYCMQPEKEGYKVIVYDSTSLADEIRGDKRLIIKAHGSIDNISKMIFTRAEYHAAKSQHAKFYDILKALFLTHTCIFIGCGLADPDIMLLMEDVKILGTQQRPHYALVLKGKNSKFKIEEWRQTYNVVALEYEPDHDALTTDLLQLSDMVEAHRFSTATA